MTAGDDAALFEALRRVTTASLCGVMLKMGLANQWVRGPLPLQPDFRARPGALSPCASFRCAKPCRAHSRKSCRSIATRWNRCPRGASPLPTRAALTDAATFGDIVVARMVKRGVAGIVTDGAVRDRNGLLATGMPIWTSGVHGASAWRPDDARGLAGTDWLRRRCCVSG